MIPEMRYDFKATIWLYEGNATWHFVTLPQATAKRVRHVTQGSKRRGWGSVRVKVTIGETTWKTSIFPTSESNSYILPLKADVRKREGLKAGKSVKITLALSES